MKRKGAALRKGGNEGLHRIDTQKAADGAASRRGTLKAVGSISYTGKMTA